MKKFTCNFLVAAVLLPAAVLAQQKMDDMKGMDMSGSKDMNMQKKAGAVGVTHIAMGEVKTVDAKSQVVTVAHEPVKTLKWPSMTMGFVIRDKMLMEKMVVGSKVQFEFVQENGKYIVTSVK